MRNWEAALETVRTRLDAVHGAREKALAGSREIIQIASKAIRALHRNEVEKARDLIAGGWERARAIRSVIEATPNVLHAGYLQDAEKELVEATALDWLIHQHPLPSPAELGVEAHTYVNGVAEAASEGRRYMLDLMRNGDLEGAKRVFEFMDLIYDDLITLDYPDAVTGGLRRTCDALRAVLERSRSDLSMTLMQSELLSELKRR
ncbi:MAG: hypothetical protein JNJ45_04770 [Chthonomonas sp.]|nr:hypothetical protein [Chthonomonas sp.]